MKQENSITLTFSKGTGVRFILLKSMHLQALCLPTRIEFGERVHINKKVECGKIVIADLRGACSLRERYGNGLKKKLEDIGAETIEVSWIN